MKYYNKTLLLLSMATVAVAPVVSTSVHSDASIINAVADVPVFVKSFKDVPESHTYYEIIREMSKKGIINGYEDGTFKPEQTISRQHAVVLINRAVDLPTKQTFVKPKDLSEKHPYYNDFKALIEADLLELDSKGNINPNKVLTRGEMAKILAVAYGLVPKVNYTFSDTKGSDVDYYVQALYSNGITTGYEDGTFKPVEPLSRAHYALFMHRASNVDEGFVPEPIADQSEQQPMPLKPSDLSQYPSDRVVTSSYLTDYYEKLVLPNSDAQTIEDKGKEIVALAKIQKEKVAELQKKIKVTARSETRMEDVVVSGQTLDERIKDISWAIEKTVPETIQIINYAYGTGDVYEGETFALRFSYASNSVEYTYRK